MSNRNLEHLDLALAELFKAGARYEIDIPRSNSVHLWVLLGRHRRLVIAAKTPSDFRCRFAVRQHVKKAINEMKLLKSD